MSKVLWAVAGGAVLLAIILAAPLLAITSVGSPLITPPPELSGGAASGASLTMGEVAFLVVGAVVILAGVNWLKSEWDDDNGGR